MADHSITARAETGPLPADDPARSLTIAQAGDLALPRLGMVGDIYTILISGKQTEGRYCLVDMLVPDGGGPPPHRHDFEELFALLEGELEFTFRGQTRTVAAPSVVNIPANAPHQFRNVSGRSAHILCMCTPAGQDEFFLALGRPVDELSSSSPGSKDNSLENKRDLLAKLLPLYRTEIL